MATRAKSGAQASRAVDRQLERYREMRDFNVTQEPSGKQGSRTSSDKPNALPFVVQKHAATRLHYDFRLGWNGVLKSWAVTKGPSYYPGDKRLAVQVEDHPIEYGGFEGTIPKGQYGGGTVMVWDYGDWKPLVDVDKGLAEGSLKFELHGKKLKGKWALVRMRGHGERPDKPNWLLIKENDSFARSASDPALTDEATDSAITQRSIEQIAKSEDHVWNSNRGDRNGAVENVQASSKAGRASAGKAKDPSAMRSALLKSAPRQAFPGFIPPQLAQQATKPPSGSDWVHELKLDGYRIQIHVPPTRRRGKEREVKLLTRKGLDWTARMPDIARAAAQLPVETAILDGEVVALDEEGRTNFADLQAAFQEGKQNYLRYFAFDLLYLDGHNVCELALLPRKELLAEVFSHLDRNSPLRLSEHLEANGEEVFKEACALGAEGIVSKLATAKYTPGRGSSWVKVKCILEQEFVIGGFTYPSTGGHGVGALLLGYYEGGKLRYAGRTGTGFTQQTHGMLRTKLDALEQKQPPFAEIPRDARHDAHWVKPVLAAQVAFTTWTRDNLVRQAAFKGLREDKPAKEVVREMAVDPEKTLAGTAAAGKGAAHRTRTSDSKAKGMTKLPAKLPITHPDKVLDPESGMTKQQLAEYYLAVAERMLPHVADRPLSVVRCPEGCGKPCFFQKHVGLGLSKGVHSVSIPNPKTGDKEDYLTVNSAEGLVGLAQMGVFELHTWGSRNESLETPDRIVFDLDPDAAIVWKTLTASAQEIRDRLQKLALQSFLKSTGGKGLHVVVPIKAEYEWPVVKEFAHRLVLSMEKDNPKLYITKMTKAARKDLIYLDYLRNDRGSTSIAPFSPRARSGVPVAMTLDWKELKSDKRPVFHVTDFENWKARLRRDPWKEMESVKQRLSADTLRAMGVQERRKGRRS
jgi:bifunctional non-homologous end joining protein LigD